MFSFLQNFRRFLLPSCCNQTGFPVSYEGKERFIHTYIGSRPLSFCTVKKKSIVFSKVHHARVFPGVMRLFKLCKTLTTEKEREDV